MLVCKADESIPRHETNGFKFPLGAYPIEPLSPKPGYTLQFEPADGGEEEGDLEEWPDRYIFDAVISAERVEPLFRMLMSLLPGRVYPILDVLGHDAYREIDPYIAYDLVGSDHFADAVRRYSPFLFEDGMVGFGALAEDPFFYLFVDEHKIITIRAEPTLKDRVERILHAFDLEQIEDPAGADSAAHEHRSVLFTPESEPDLLGPSEIIEQLRDHWQLVLNVDPDSNVDDDGKELGITAWRCVLRCEFEKGDPRYAEVLLRAEGLRDAEETAFDAVDQLVEKDKSQPRDVFVVASDRLKPEQLGPIRTQARRSKHPGGGTGFILSARWLEG
jgi:hypothetical protein